MKISQKQAIFATQNQKMENRLMANKMKLKAETLLNELDIEIMEEIEDNRKLAKDVKALRETAPREAEKKVLVKNKRRRDRVKVESEKRYVGHEKLNYFSFKHFN